VTLHIKIMDRRSSKMGARRHGGTRARRRGDAGSLGRGGAGAPHLGGAEAIRRGVPLLSESGCGCGAVGGLPSALAYLCEREDSSLLERFCNTRAKPFVRRSRQLVSRQVCVRAGWTVHTSSIGGRATLLREFSRGSRRGCEKQRSREWSVQAGRPSHGRDRSGKMITARAKL